MNIKEELTCQCCNEIYYHPITLTCGDNICKHHVEELISKSSSNKFKCPLCNEENAIQSFKINKLIERLIKRDLHEFKINPKNEKILNHLKFEIEKLSVILKDPDNVLYEEISELKRQVDLDREKLKSHLDDLADGLINELGSYEARFKAEYKANLDFKQYNNLLKSAKKELIKYEECLSLFSVDNEKRDEKCKEVEKFIQTIQSKINELKEKLFSNVSINYRKTEVNSENMFGKLIIQVSSIKSI